MSTSYTHKPFKKTWDDAAIKDVLRSFEIVEQFGGIKGGSVNAVITGLTDVDVKELRNTLRSVTYQMAQLANAAKESGDTVLYDLYSKRTKLLMCAMNFDTMTIERSKERVIDQVIKEQLQQVDPLTEMEKITRDEFKAIFDPTTDETVIDTIIDKVAFVRAEETKE